MPERERREFDPFYNQRLNYLFKAALRSFAEEVLRSSLADYFLPRQTKYSNSLCVLD